MCAFEGRIQLHVVPKLNSICNTAAEETQRTKRTISCTSYLYDLLSAASLLVALILPHFWLVLLMSLKAWSKLLTEAMLVCWCTDSCQGDWVLKSLFFQYFLCNGFLMGVNGSNHCASALPWAPEALLMRLVSFEWRQVWPHQLCTWMSRMLLLSPTEISYLEAQKTHLFDRGRIQQRFWGRPQRGSMFL